MHQAAHLHDLALPMLLPGITVNTSPTDYESIKRTYARRFTGKTSEILEMRTASN
jgi:branched-chain amino acid transport system substrate-binding protein